MAELKNLIVEGDSRLIGDTNAGKITASSIVKSGGTSSQFLKADGSVDSNSYSTTSHTHTTTLATDSGTSSITLSAGGKYKLTTGGTNVIFTMPTGSGADIYWVTYGTTTYADCKTAFDAGKLLICKMADQWDEDEMMMLGTYRWHGGRFTFSCFNGVEKYLYYTTLENSSSANWSAIQYINLYNLEHTDGRTSAITSGNATSTVYYTSVKSVVDYVDGKITGIYDVSKTAGSGISSLCCSNGNIIFTGSSGTYIATLDNFFVSFMKSIGAYDPNASLTSEEKLEKLAHLMCTSYIIKRPTTSGNITKYSNSYMNINYVGGEYYKITLGVSASGNRIEIDHGGTVTLTVNS